MTDFTHEFDYLKLWASLTDSEIGKVISDDNVRILQRAANLLREEESHELTIVDRYNFVSSVKDLIDVYIAGSQLLSEMIIKVADFSDHREMEKAKSVYQDFLKFCPTKFYRDIARDYMDKKMKGK